MFGKWGLFVLAALASAAVLTSSAGAVTQGSAGVNVATVSTRAGVVQYLASLGINAHGIVVQRGAHNYAGPNCPGKAWTCTTAKRVLQIAANDADNKFVCSASTGPGGSASSPSQCTIVQIAAGGDNNANCVEWSGDSSVSQSCRISQSNTTGANNIEVQQYVAAINGATQTASQYAGSTQSNNSGTNTAYLTQNLYQTASVVDSSGAQTQDGHQAASASQSSTTGNNLAFVVQVDSVSASATGGASITQKQNTDGSLNSNTGVSQSSNSGKNTATVNQTNTYGAKAANTPTAFQQQGSSTGGMNVSFSQSSTGKSSVKNNQSETQNLKDPGVGSVTQIQYGPLWADPNQGSNPNDTYSINQNSQQHATDPSLQNDQEYGQCSTSGNCTVTETVQQQNNDARTNSCSGSSCDIGQNVTMTDGEQSSQSCSGSDSDFSCPPPPPPPPPPFPNNTCGIDCIP